MAGSRSRIQTSISSRAKLKRAAVAGAQLGNFERGAGIFVRKDEIKHGLSPSVKCVAPLHKNELYV